MRQFSYDQLVAEDRTLLKRAEEARERAYNPYSKFFVGAALRTKKGTIITGANVENASFGGTICAERTAIVRANVEGHREFRAIAISTRGETFGTTDVSGPCGMCRQVLYEFQQLADYPLSILMSNTDRSKIMIANLDELLALGFGPKDLGVDLRKYRGQ